MWYPGSQTLENGDLLQQIVSNKSFPKDASPAIVVDSEKVSGESRDDLISTLLDKVHHYQRFLVKEREISALREASFEQNFRAVHRIVKDSMKTIVCEHQDHKNGDPKKSKSPTMATTLDPRETGQIRELAEQKAEQATVRIAHLELKSEGLSLLRSHNNQVDLELDVLKLRLKKLETMALEFVPLSEQDVLLDFEEYKEQLLKVQTKQKQRRKKEERWRLWRD
ncbi:hypothetical protein BDD12DRAFT_72415 [Trichophaea hybrida]|nr:hypothetical protein BDD12DRAFT_72415 [Trichophaea hybrida]